MGMCVIPSEARDLALRAPRFLTFGSERHSSQMSSRAERGISTFRVTEILRPRLRMTKLIREIRVCRIHQSTTVTLSGVGSLR